MMQLSGPAHDLSYLFSTVFTANDVDYNGQQYFKIEWQQIKMLQKVSCGTKAKTNAHSFIKLSLMINTINLCSKWFYIMECHFTY